MFQTETNVVQENSTEYAYNAESMTWPFGSRCWTTYSAHNPPGSIDVQLRMSSDVLAIADGEVTGTCESCPVTGGIGNQCSCRPITGCGNFVQVKHDDDGVVTTYCHLTKPISKKGDRVKAGDTIGISGSSGNSSGPHLHIHRSNQQDMKTVFSANKCSQRRTVTVDDIYDPDVYAGGGRGSVKKGVLLSAT